MTKWLVLLIACASLLHQSTGIFLSWKKNTNLTDNDIFIAFSKLYGPRNNKMSEAFENLTRLSLDERCALGMPLSVAWSLNEPYSGLLPIKVGKNMGLAVRGIFPDVLKRMVRYCCNNKTEIIYGMFLRSVRQADQPLSKGTYDFTFPMYVSKRNKYQFKGKPFIPVVTAPRVLLMVYSDGKVPRTRKLATTILSAWPFLMFMLGAATVAGLIVWFFEHLINTEFSNYLFTGAWDGFWWAVVTMTTVGYGDRSPKSTPGRVFSLLWIIAGINIIAIFTAIVTASVTASTKAHFNILGAKIGAVNGSEEFRFGVSLNLDMQAFSFPAKLTEALTNQKVDGILIDNYALTRFDSMMEDDPIREEKAYDHPITYGLVMSTGSEQMEKCGRRYMRNYNHEIFDHIAKYLVPLKTSQNKQSYAVKASEGLFYEEDTFSTLIRNGVIVVASLVCAGLIWEFTFRRRKLRRADREKAPTSLTPTDSVSLNRTAADSKKELVLSFQKFHGLWIEQLSNLSQRKARAKP